MIEYFLIFLHVTKAQNTKRLHLKSEKEKITNLLCQLIAYQF